MARNVLVSWILVLGATGIANAFSWDWNNRMENFRNIPRWQLKYLRQRDTYPHLKYNVFHHDFYFNDFPLEHQDDSDYQTRSRALAATEKPTIAPKVKIQDDWSRFFRRRPTTTQAVESNENIILTSDTYDDVPENSIGCDKTGCIQKLHLVSSQNQEKETGKDSNTLENITELNSSLFNILLNSSSLESNSSKIESESNSLESNEDTALENATVSEILLTTKNSSEFFEGNSSSSYFNTGNESSVDINDLPLTQTYSTSGDGNDSVNSSVTSLTTQTLDNSTDGDTPGNVSISDDETVFTTQTATNSTDSDESADASVSVSSTVSFDNGTDEFTESTIEIELSTESPGTEEDMTISQEISSDVPVPNTTISGEKETSESNIPSQTEFNSSTEAQLASSQTPEAKSPASDSISSSEDEGSFTSSTSVKVEKTTVEISSTLSSKGSTSSKSEITTEAVSQDHNIKISSVRTARMIVTVVFLVIVLIATTVLAVCVFKAKRRAVEYDQLTLLP